MPYAPFVLSSDRRHRYGMLPLRLLNLFAQPLPAEANKPVKACLLPIPGRTLRIDLGAPIQGMFAEPGVRGGLLHVVADGVLYSISSSWASTNIGAISGSADPVFAGLRDKLYVAAGDKPYQWDGSSLTQVADVDAPNATSLLVLAQRLVAAEDNADTYFWSETLDGTDWESLGFATAEQRPDAIRRMIRLSGQIIAFGASSIEIIRATPQPALPFANITSQSIDETNGILGKHAYAISGDKVFFVGGDLISYVMIGFAVKGLPVCGELEDELRALSDADRALTTCWTYKQGTNEFFVIRPNGKQAYVHDFSTGLWHNRQTWEEDTYAPRFYANAYGHDIVADENGTAIYTLHSDVFDDAGVTIERKATLRLPVPDYESIGSLCVDLQAFGRPASGQGSNPSLMIDVSTDGRSNRDDSRSEVMLSVGPDGNYRKPVVWGLGMIPPGDGAVITFRQTDPAGIALYGAWLNEGQKS